MAFIAAWYFGGGAGGCGGGGGQGACTKYVNADPAVFSYTLGQAQYLQGSPDGPTHWYPAYTQSSSPFFSAPSVAISSTAYQVCAESGGITGPVPEDALYECPRAENGFTTESCPGGVCPTPCYEYHLVKGHTFDGTGSKEYYGTHAADTGDGIAQASSAAAGIQLRVIQSLFERIHDDAIECDWGCDVNVDDTAVQNVGSFFLAMRPRDSQPVDMTKRTITLNNDIVKFQTMVNTYKVSTNGTGHGGLLKLQDGNCPTAITVTNNKIAMNKCQAGNASGDCQPFPPAVTGLVCSGNTLYWYGTNQAYLNMLASTGGEAERCDGLTNGQRLAWYQNHGYGSCFTIVQRCQDPANQGGCTSQTAKEFLDTSGFSNAMENWKLNHTAAAQ